MSHNFEKLSALIDNELSESEVGNVKKILSSDEDKNFYLRQQIIKDVLHGEQVAVIPANFADKISAQIADEPAIFAPNNIKANVSGVKQKVVGLAIAASVAMVSFIMLQDNNLQTGVPNFNQQEVAKVIRAEGIQNAGVNAVNNEGAVNSGYQLASDRQTISPNKWQGLSGYSNDAYKTMINQYLATHTEVSTVNNIQGIMPYSKIVGDDSK